MPKLILRIETEEGKNVEREFEGATRIAYLLEEAGILDNELVELLADP